MKLKKIPKFKSEKEEAEFWSSHDTTEYIDWGKAKRTIFPNLKPTSRAVPIKLPTWLIESLKFLANRHHTSYQSLLRSYVEKEVEMELRSAAK
ncbi:MAG: BrnA antitoxin family protein [Elusimicrobia bacterium]|nr:BrnA antitoxin family protein [Elusimicrobiota bacterium]